jgi:DNA repair protein RadA/Sms
MQVANAIAMQDKKVIYFSGEESLSQLYQRARRIRADSNEIFLANASEVNSIVAAMETECPDLLVVDSIQTVYNEDIASSAGSIIQVRNGTLTISSAAKKLGVSAILISHITKEGNIAGPKIIEHIVDVVISFEGDENRGNRILRSSKNRFSSTNEIGIFEMTEAGLSPIENPSKIFLSERIQNTAGSVVMPTIAGVRPILVEIQALVTRSHDNYPRRSSNGIDYNRAMLMVAVLEKRAGLKLYSSDVYLNVASGLRISEPACDLAAAVAIASSYYGKPIDPNMAVFGEVGLAGEVRSVSYTAQRFKEIESLGFERVLSPKLSKKVCSSKSQLDIIETIKIEDALRKLGIRDINYASAAKKG